MNHAAVFAAEGGGFVGNYATCEGNFSIDIE